VIFVDASALIAIITGEPDADGLADRLTGSATRLCSALAIWETTAGLCRSYRFAPHEAQGRVTLFLEAAAIRMVAIAERESRLALDAYARYGKGRHPAGLNMGDCFAYACATAHHARLLYKGNDFALTDLA
jgi:ribonuclease VapC